MSQNGAMLPPSAPRNYCRERPLVASWMLNAFPPLMRMLAASVSTMFVVVFAIKHSAADCGPKSIQNRSRIGMGVLGGPLVKNNAKRIVVNHRKSSQIIVNRCKSL